MIKGRDRSRLKKRRWQRGHAIIAWREDCAAYAFFAVVVDASAVLSLNVWFAQIGIIRWPHDRSAHNNIYSYPDPRTDDLIALSRMTGGGDAAPVEAHVNAG
jgi:hypothetical protein